MKIRMKDTRRGSEDGFVVRRYYKDCIYNVAHTMGCYFITQGWAVAVADETPVSDEETILAAKEQVEGPSIMEMVDDLKSMVDAFHAARPVPTNPETTRLGEEWS